MQCKCLNCGRYFVLDEAEADKFREFFERQVVSRPQEPFGICPQCWEKAPEAPLELPPAL